MADEDYTFLSSLSANRGRQGDTSNLNPTFASNLAAAIREARAAGLNVSLNSAFRTPGQTGSSFDASGRSLHSYGLASDIGGLGGPNSPAAKQWAAIAAKHGLYNPYGIGNTKEFNHWQALPYELGAGSSQLAALQAAAKTGNQNAIWAAGNTLIPGTITAGGGSSGGGGASGSFGTTVNTANAPVQGALSGSQPGMTADPRQLVYNKLTAAGLQPHQALGAVWSLAGESGKGLNPGAYNPKDPGGAVGIGQWNGPRRRALEAFAQQRGTPVTDPNTQADFLIDELTNKNAATYQPGVFARMQGANTAQDATRVWTTQFERPKIDNSAARIKNGANIASLDSSGNFILGGGGGGTAVASAAPTTDGTAPAATTPAADQPWWSKFVTPGATDPKTGQPGQSPLQQAAEAFSPGGGAQPKTGKELMEEQAPERSMLAGGPGARNVSPGLQNIGQTYGQTLNSFNQPLTWNNAPPRIAGMAPAGFQGSMATQPYGMSLNSFQIPSTELGYGIPAAGFGYG